MSPKISDSMGIKRSNPLVWLVDPLAPTSADAHAAYRFSWSQMAWLIPLAIGIAGLAVSAVGWATDAKQFYFSYLVGWTFCLSLALGGLFFVLIQHLTKARWSVVVRRIPEALLWSFPMLAILGIPVVLGMHDLYHWTHAELFDPANPAYDKVIAGKEPYLNTPFFLGRLVFYFLVWSIVSYKLYTRSIAQDLDADPAIPAKQRFTAAWGLALTAITVSFGAFDILMSLDPHWFSTIFGVYFFAGAFMSIMAFTAFTAMLLQRKGMLKGVVTVEHYQDLGKFLFGFVVFWAYIAFSQYMLIWYANLPEETLFFRYRTENGWEIHSAVLIIMHFILPFMILIGRWAKRSLPILGFMCVWMLVMQWFDLHWIVMPVLHDYHAMISLYDIAAWFGLTGVFVSAFMYRLSRHALVPQNDPNLGASIAFKNS